MKIAIIVFGTVAGMMIAMSLLAVAHAWPCSERPQEAGCLTSTPTSTSIPSLIPTPTNTATPSSTSTATNTPVPSTTSTPIIIIVTATPVTIVRVVEIRPPATGSAGLVTW